MPAVRGAFCGTDADRSARESRFIERVRSFRFQFPVFRCPFPLCLSPVA